jgi:anti-anti-sigma regulatory factor
MMAAEQLASHLSSILIVDGSTINTVDITGAEMLESLAGDLAARGVRFVLASLSCEVCNKLKSAEVVERTGTNSLFQTLNTASDTFLHRVRRS